MYCVFHHISGHLPRQIWFWKISTKTWASVRPSPPLLGQMPNFFRKWILRAPLNMFSNNKCVKRNVSKILKPPKRLKLAHLLKLVLRFTWFNAYFCKCVNCTAIFKEAPIFAALCSKRAILAAICTTELFFHSFQFFFHRRSLRSTSLHPLCLKKLSAVQVTVDLGGREASIFDNMTPPLLPPTSLW